MKTQKFITNYMGYTIEVILTLPLECTKTYSSIPESFWDECSEDIENGDNGENFQDIPNDDLYFTGDGFKLSGSWRRLDLPYELIKRLVMWRNNCFTPSDFPLQLFITYFGEKAGKDYHSKWIDRKGDLLDMFGCFVSAPEDGQTFCNMVMEQVEQYENQKK